MLLPSHLCLGLPSGFLLGSFPTKILYSWACYMSEPLIRLQTTKYFVSSFYFSSKFITHRWEYILLSTIFSNTFHPCFVLEVLYKFYTCTVINAVFKNSTSQPSFHFCAVVANASQIKITHSQ
jgi:hypothetical protein